MKTKVHKSPILDIAEKGVVTIAISRFGNEDYGEDIVHKGAFKRTFEQGGNRIKHFIDHSIRQAAIVGLPMKMYETDTHAVVESALNLEKQISRDLFSDYKFFQAAGKSLDHSFGYDTIQGKARTKKGEDIFELKMYEYSTVGIGMNPETPLLDLKSLGEDDIPALEELLRKFDVTNAKGKQIESIIKQIKELKDPATATLSENSDPEIPLAKKLNEILNTKKIF